MYESFENLEEEKKQKIIAAGIEEFALKGYEKASTNQIVKQAGISKGLLFHYFGSKKNLFMYLLNHIMDHMVQQFYHINISPAADIFERLLQQGMTKLKMAYAEPLLYEFLYKAFINTPKELESELEAIQQRLYRENLEKFYVGLDTSQFREDIDSQKAIEIITFFLDGLNTYYINQFRNRQAQESLAEMDEIIARSREYFEILKKGIYK